MRPAGRDVLTVRRTVVEVMCEILPHVPAEEITDDKRLGDLGADSVDRVEIVSSIRDRLGDGRPLSTFAELPTIGSLIAFLAGEGR